MSPTSKLALRSTDRVGHVAAEEDYEILASCFVDNRNEIDVLKDVSDPRSIVLGRTGSGKTALLLRVSQREDICIDILPENLAIEYVSNSTILRFLTDTLDIRLDVFFKLLWRHVIAIEIIKHKFGIFTREDKEGFISQIREHFRTEQDRRAISYLDRYGNSFWEETDVRVKEVTTNVENSIRAELGLTQQELYSIEVGGHSGFSEQRQTEIKHRAYRVINNVQARKLSEIIGLVESILDDPQKSYYICIDKLDENWVGDSLKYKLIRSLIDTGREFNSDVYSLKVIIALRQDLIQRVIEKTKDRGFQAEKYESLYIPIRWSREKIKDILDVRINYLFKYKYTKQDVSSEDILPPYLDGKPTIDYMIDRTLLRPRDIIIFFNKCVENIDGAQVLTEDIIKRAEFSYSESRLQSIQDEWQADHPNLRNFIYILHRISSTFMLSDIDSDEIDRIQKNLINDGRLFLETIPPESISGSLQKKIEGEISWKVFRTRLFTTLFDVGMVGIKSFRSSDFRWSVSYSSNVSPIDFDEDTQISIHPAFWSALGIQ